MTTTATLTISARFVFPVDHPPVAQGSVTIAEDRILAVNSPGVRPADIHFDNAAIVPGFVNAHTHLDLTGLRGLTPPSSDFVGWLHQVIRQRREQSPDQAQRDIERGIQECLDAGTTLVGDIASAGQSWRALSQSKLRSVVFYELLGLSKARAHQAWSAACAWLSSIPQLDHCFPALSPHAPYSVRRSLFAAARRLASARRMPMAVHVAESTAELELLESRSGPMAPFLKDLGVYDADGLVDSVDDLLELLGDNSGRLLIHGNYLLASKIKPGLRLVYCPRTHFAFGHPIYPLPAFLNAGACIALGTDSLASNPDLSVFNEARFVRQQFQTTPAEAVLQMATLHGAQVLSQDSQTGSLTAGKSADLVVIDLPKREAADPADLVLDQAARVRGVMIGGAWHKHPRSDGSGS